MTTTPNADHNDHDADRATGQAEDGTDQTATVPFGPLYRDEDRCACGAEAGRDGACRKCRARSSWERRRSAPKSRRPASSRNRDSRRPDGRRPGR